MSEAKYGFTFGYGHVHPVTKKSLGNCYVMVPGDTYDEARENMLRQFGREWAFQYPADKIEDMKRRFTLTEIPWDDDIASTARRARVNKLVNTLMKPTFILQMARSTADDKRSHHVKSAKTRANNAAAEIESIVIDWVRELEN